MKYAKIRVNSDDRKVTSEELWNAVKALAGENCGNNDKVLITAVLSHIASGNEVCYDS